MSTRGAESQAATRSNMQRRADGGIHRDLDVEVIRCQAMPGKLAWFSTGWIQTTGQTGRNLVEVVIV